MKSNLHVATIVFEVGISLPITIPWYCVAPTIRLLYSPPHLTVVTKHLTVVTNTPHTVLPLWLGWQGKLVNWPWDVLVVGYQENRSTTLEAFTQSTFM